MKGKRVQLDSDVLTIWAVVVIPKEIRRTLRIREGDPPLEIFVDREGEVILKNTPPPSGN